MTEEIREKMHFWLVNVMQFFFGGIFSTYLVFYFRSGTIATSWPFLVVLAAAFIANERLKRHYARLAFQLSLLFLAYYAFRDLSHADPVPSDQHTNIYIERRGKPGRHRHPIRDPKKIFTRTIRRQKKLDRTRVRSSAIFIGVNLLYFYNLIPPLPLSLKDAGIYQSLTVNGPGNYTVQRENQGLAEFFEWSQTIHVVPGDPLYAYTAVFSPPHSTRRSCTCGNIMIPRKKRQRWPG